MEQTNEQMTDRPFVFVYAKSGKVKVLSHQQAIDEEKALKAEGWTHTATLDAAIWMQYLCNIKHGKESMINELKRIK